MPEYFDNAIRPRLGGDIEYIGDVGGAEKLELIQKARVLMHPPGGMGWVEAGAIIVMEALHCGTPCVVSDNGCLPEYIENGVNGFICYTHEDFMNAIKSCDTVNPGRCRRSASFFRRGRMAREYAQLLRDMIAGARW